MATIPNPNPAEPEPIKKMITKARKDENTKKDMLNFVLSRFRVFVMKIFSLKMQRYYFVKRLNLSLPIAQSREKTFLTNFKKL